MSISKQINLDIAEKIFATANTPLFLLRKLRSDPETVRIRSRHSSDEILRELRNALKDNTGSFRSSVLPYVLLVTLSLDLENHYLIEASKLKAPHHRWFVYSCNYLLNEFRPTVIGTLKQKRSIIQSLKRSDGVNTVVITGS
jgi:hypothetical protein